MTAFRLLSRLPTGLETLLIFAAPILLLPVLAGISLLAGVLLGAAYLPLAAHRLALAALRSDARRKLLPRLSEPTLCSKNNGEYKLLS